MKPGKIWANVCVRDLDRTAKFYSKLGFTPNVDHNVTDELTSFLFGEGDFVIHFFLRNKLETNTRLKFADARDSNEILFTLSAENREQVDQWAWEVDKVGGHIISRPEAFGEGYYGFIFADPDGHRFNVFYM